MKKHYILPALAALLFLCSSLAREQKVADSPDIFELYTIGFLNGGGKTGDFIQLDDVHFHHYLLRSLEVKRENVVAFRPSSLKSTSEGEVWLESMVELSGGLMASVRTTLRMEGEYYLLTGEICSCTRLGSAEFGLKAGTGCACEELGSCSSCRKEHSMHLDMSKSDFGL